MLTDRPADPDAPRPARREKFWAVWSPQGGNPTVKVGKFAAARAIAQKLAAKHPAQDWYVLESVWSREAEEHDLESPPES